jgi:hypothetical protein
MKAIAIEEISVRRNELLDDLAHGEIFAVIEGGREVATLSPRCSKECKEQPQPDDAFYRMAELASRSTDDGAHLSNADMDHLIYAG